MKKPIPFLCMSLGLLLASCVSSPDPGPNPPPDPEKITYDDLKIKNLSLLPDLNERIFGTVAFRPDQTGLQWTAAVEGYRLDRSALVATFEAVAAKIEVAGTAQVSGSTPNDFSKPVVYTLYADDGSSKEFTATLDNSGATGMPVLGITTEGERDVTSRDDWLDGRLVLDAGQSDWEELSLPIEIKGRGHNSWSRDKKPYALKLSEKNSVMGMPKHKRWVLLANAGDRTLLRNRVAFEIGRRTGLEWTPRSQFVEVVLNGKYLGNYLLTEQIKVDKNRVAVDEMTSQDIAGEPLTGGYLLEIDRYYDDICKFRTRLRDLPVNLKDPDEDILTDEQRTYIVDYMDRVEELLYTGAAPDPDYASLIDVDSFVDWWIVCELCHNRDVRLPGSCYMYKKRGGKLFAGPLWDFDLTTFIPSTSFLLFDYEVSDEVLADPEGDRSLWYKRLFADPAFRARAKERWRALLPELRTIPAFVDREAAAIEASAAANWAIWKLEAGSNRDEGLAWRDAVELLKTNYSNRLEWMNSAVEAF